MRTLLGKIGRTWVRPAIERVREATGQTLAEYSVVITVVALGVTVLALLAFRGSLAAAFNAVTNCLDGSC
jgi:Flp pilus assembly pilin Flp